MKATLFLVVCVCVCACNGLVTTNAFTADVRMCNLPGTSGCITGTMLYSWTAAKQRINYVINGSVEIIDFNSTQVQACMVASVAMFCRQLKCISLSFFSPDLFSFSEAALCEVRSQLRGLDVQSTNAAILFCVRCALFPKRFLLSFFLF